MTWISSITTFFLGDYAIAIDKVNHCFDCGNEFSPMAGNQEDLEG